MAVGRVSTNQFATAKFIVDTNGLSAGATHSTIASALTDASSGETIFIKPGTYTENLTLKAGVNLVAFTVDGFTPNVTIIGKLSGSYSGTASISGLRLTTNGDNAIALTGANVTSLFVNDCYLNFDDNTGISSTGSNSSAVIRLTNCKGDLGTTGIKFFDCTNGSLSILNTFIGNSGGSVTASTFSGADMSIEGSNLKFAITTSGATADTKIVNCHLTIGTLNATALNANSTSANGTTISNSSVYSGTSTPITVGAGATVLVSNVTLFHSNAVAVSGAGTIVYGAIEQTSTVGTVSPSNSTKKGVVAGGIYFDGGTDILDVYDQGSWTPTLGGSSADPTTITYTTQVGRYTRIGNTVFYFGNVVINAFTVGAAAGNLEMRGLPFTSANVSNLFPIGSVYMSGVNLTNATPWVTCQVLTNNTEIVFNECVDNTTPAVTPVTALAAGDIIIVSGFYYV